MIHSFDSLKAALEPDYRVLREIARAVSVVLLAEDRRQDRLVAIKILRPECACSTAAERFLREIRIAARLQHPNILPLYHAGEVLGLPFYVMPYVGGETLRDRIRGERPVPAPTALTITETVGRALEYAHRQNVVHRDIKPENILFWNECPVLTDFGIAVPVGSPRPEWRTEPRHPIGTPEYMSPEQAAGNEDVSAASDVYSLACVLYEMMSGRPPFIGSAHTVMTQHLSAEPPLLRAVAPAVPVRVSDAVHKALAKAPADRFATAGEFVSALLEQPNGSSHARPVVAVFPFVDVTRRPGFNTLTDRVTEGIVGPLSGSPDLEVTAAPAGVRVGRHTHVREIGQRLGVDFVLLGSLRAAAGAVRVTAQLIRVNDARYVWCGRYDRLGNGGPALEDEVSADIAHRVREALVSSPGTGRPPRALAAAG